MDTAESSEYTDQYKDHTIFGSVSQLTSFRGSLAEKVVSGDKKTKKKKRIVLTCLHNTFLLLEVAKPFES